MRTVGIDAHKHVFTVAIVDDRGTVTQVDTVDRNAATPDRLLASVAELPTPRQWGIEGSGMYGRQVAQALVASGETVFEVPGSCTAMERRRSRGREAEKTDVTDAVAIARVVLRDHQRLPRVTADGAPTQCRLLTEHRQNLLQERSRLLN